MDKVILFRYFRSQWIRNDPFKIFKITKVNLEKPRKASDRKGKKY